MNDKNGNSPDSTNFILLRQHGLEFLNAAKVLAGSGANLFKMNHQRPLATLLGHSIELTLKGLLSIATMSAGEPIPFTHDLEKLASDPKIKSTLSLSDDERCALEILNGVFAYPYIARYPKLGLQSFPNPDAFSILLNLAKRLSTLLDSLAHQQNLEDPIVRTRLGAD